MHSIGTSNALNNILSLSKVDTFFLSVFKSKIFQPTSKYCTEVAHF